MIGRAHHIPGVLMPVNRAATEVVADLFPRNERIVCSIDGPLGRVAVVAVGACNVGRISTAFDPSWLSGRGVDVKAHRAARAESRRYDPAHTVRQGDEIMAFHLGSTVLLLVGRGHTLEPAITPGTEVHVGQPITRLS